jgi:hypothetical protein
MRRRYSIIRNPAFQKIALIIDFFYFVLFIGILKQEELLVGLKRDPNSFLTLVMVSSSSLIFSLSLHGLFTNGRY